MRLSLIAAVSENNIIGRTGGLPWRLSDDLRRFKRLTMGHAIVMGRQTWESIGRPLPGRVSIVVTRKANWRAGGAIGVSDLDEAIEVATTSDVAQNEVFVCGGGELYRTALPQADRIYLTRVHAQIEGDVTFPAVVWSEWKLIDESSHEPDERNDYPTSVQVWIRK